MPIPDDVWLAGDLIRCAEPFCVEVVERDDADAAGWIYRDGRPLCPAHRQGEPRAA